MCWIILFIFYSIYQNNRIFDHLIEPIHKTYKRFDFLIENIRNIHNIFEHCDSLENIKYVISNCTIKIPSHKLSTPSINKHLKCYIINISKLNLPTINKDFMKNLNKNTFPQFTRYGIVADCIDNGHESVKNCDVIIGFQHTFFAYKNIYNVPIMLFCNNDIGQYLETYNPEIIESVNWGPDYKPFLHNMITSIIHDKRLCLIKKCMHFIMCTYHNNIAKLTFTTDINNYLIQFLIV